MNFDSSLNSFVWYLLLFGVAVFLLLMIHMIDNPKYDLSFRNLFIKPLKKRFAKPQPAVVGYKKAGFSGPDALYPFTGVMGQPYGVVDSAVMANLGFHMYETLQKALDHPQEGNVCLEVTGYGSVEKCELGYISDRQRVIQMIVGECNYCGYPASGWDNYHNVWVCHLDGRLIQLKRGTYVQFEEIERKMEAKTGHRVAVRSNLGRDKRGLLRGLSQKKNLPQFVPITQLVKQENTLLA